ncbi:hypothetical protein A2154_05300 [Candidatus Gottesmanbacteria bacterium RBG_16_43_7]|uniref:DUF86 domain-containing protein n=1 Tax=Candidatus Gottesmanbacteria bacterium RBG_16_43_7 TaxID=1798373 RepID=A0A1F5Z932_9BACT|nr:MAG: hypothetical protein A2154_05300 [Candidatus Gottesmanbacteria bacterium RBG_16_43_7]
MEKSNKIYLEDIIQAIKLILEDYVYGISFEKFNKDKKTQDAVIRQIAIIGEVMGKLDKDFIENHPELPGKEAISMRNVLVHDYDWVDTEEVWRTIERDLPKLKQTVETILKEEF